MWPDHEKDYCDAVPHSTFLCGFEPGARQKAENVIPLSGDIAVENVIEIGCDAGSVSQQLRSPGCARKYRAVEVSGSLDLRLLTTHSTSLCRAIDQRSASEAEPRGPARLLSVANTADSAGPLKSS
jgi:hypothetical protein